MKAKFKFVENNNVKCQCDFGATLYRAILTIFTISDGIAKTRRDKNIVPMAQLKTHLSRWVFVFTSREQ